LKDNSGMFRPFPENEEFEVLDELEDNYEQ